MIVRVCDNQTHNNSDSDNEYYKLISGSPDLANDAPDWTHIQLDNGLVQFVRNDGIPPRRIFMLNVDIGLVRDMDGFGFLPACKFKGPNMCPIASTLTKVGMYRNDNLAWLNDFKKVLVRMLEKGLV
jgi:hypothetical protein